MKEYDIMLGNMTVFITGVAGFIGSSLAKRLLEIDKGVRIVGLDNMNDYYSVILKKSRIEDLMKHPDFIFIEGDLENEELIDEIFKGYSPDVVVNLAAQAGVRYSITNPDVYIQTNILGFYHILEACRSSYNNGKSGVQHLIYASSSSVYGLNKKIPYAVEDKTDSPISLYAATKKSNELMAHAYSKLYGIPTTGLRFFTVYGPAGRPDMAYFSFTNKLLAGQDIEIYNYGKCQRDFTYIDDIVEGMMNIIQSTPAENVEGVPYKIYNIGNNQPVELLEFVDILQEELIRAGVLSKDYDFQSHTKFIAEQPGDLEITYADVSGLENDFGFKPSTSLRTGLRNFSEWYRSFYLIRD